MPCSAGCGHDPSDPEHVMPGEGAGTDLLTSRSIDIENVFALNAEDEDQVKHIFKPWDMRLNEEKYLRSDADEQILVRVPFTGQVKLRSIIIKGARGQECPTQMKVFSNIPDMDFDSVESEKATQVVNLIDSRDAVEYPVPAARYPAVTVLTLFFNQNAGGDQSQIYYLGFKGEFSRRADRPGSIVYEKQANPADHVRLPGMGVGLHSSLGS
ncbi:MAG: hypothetical protein CYPHOPRED_000493 [Cyphobasidiales sp. Tagirdzhanova-0007]|nr:MAG: hypothetical protein CYPHOPRED_000493 [Cyphobasidiales sp. Tagirdzhanova-0007]